MFKKRDSLHIILSRLFLAVVFFISGLSGFVEFETYGLFSLSESSISTVTQTPHFYALKAIELAIGLSFIANFFVQTALIVAVPIVVSAIGFHVWEGSMIGVWSLITLIPCLNLLYFYRDTYKLFFKPQIYTNHMAEETPKILTYNEVREKSPGLEKAFEEIYTKVSAS